MTHSKKTYIYTNCEYGIEHHIIIPFNDYVDELVHILLIKHNLPLHIEEGKHLLFTKETIYLYLFCDSRT